MYAYVKNVPIQVKLRSYYTIQQLFTSNAKIDNNTVISKRDDGAYHMDNKNIFIQHKKLIAINNNNKSGQRGAKVPDSTINGGKSYPLV